MRRKLIVRFLLAYVLITICIQTLSGSAWVILHWLSPARYGPALSLWVILQHFLTSLGRRLTDLLLPGTDMSAVAGLLISASILLAGAMLFTRGPVRDYHHLCDKVRRLSTETEGLEVVEKGEPDMELWLDAVAVRVADMEDALQAQRADCQTASLLLDAASAQIEVLVEAGSFSEGSAEAGLAQEALAKVRKANAKIG